MSMLRPLIYRRFAFLLPLLVSARARRVWGGCARGLAWSLGLVYVLFAVSVLLLRYWLLPLVPDYRHDIEAQVGQALGLPVTIGRIDADWQGLNPRLSLREVHIADRAGRPALAFDRIDSVLSWWSVPVVALRFDSIDIVAPALHIRRESDGHLFVAGIPVDSADGDSGAADWVLKQNIIRIRDASVVWQDDLRQAPPLTLEKLNFMLDNDLGGRHRFGLTALPPAALASRLDLRGDFHGADLASWRNWFGQLFVELPSADLSGWHAWLDYPLPLAQGQGGLRLWLGLDGRRLLAGKALGGVTSATVDLSLRDVRVQLGAGLPELDLASLGGRLSASQQRDGSFSLIGRQLALATRDGIQLPATNFSVNWLESSDKKGPKGGKGSIQTTALDLQTLTALAAYLPFDAATARLLVDHAPRGRLQALRASWSISGEELQSWSLQSHFAGLGTKAREGLPGFDNISGEIDANERKGLLLLHSRKAALDMPAIFAEPRLVLDELDGKVAWAHDESKDSKDSKRLVVTIDSLDFANADARGSASGRYSWGGSGAGEIDLTARLAHGDARAVWRYMPLVVGKDARDWLKTGLTAGRATDTHLMLKGDLDRFPFRDGSGKFVVAVKVDGGSVDYAPGWPVIEGIKGEVLFEGPGMVINASEGRIFGARLGPVRVSIDDFDVPDPILNIKGHAAGPSADFLKFIEKSAVADYIDHFTDEMRASGDARLELGLSLPLNHLDDTKVNGDFQLLPGNQLTIDPVLPPLTAAQGRLQFTENGLRIPALAGSILGAPLKIVAGNQGDTLSLAVQGSASIRELRKQIDSPLLDALSGSTAWRADIRVKKKAAEITFESNLLGISSSLPEPFNKTANEALPLKLSIAPGSSSGSPAALRSPSRAEAAISREQIKLELGKVASVLLLRHKEASGWVLDRGAVSVGDNAVLPEHGINVALKQHSIDADRWQALLGSSTHTASAPLLPLSNISLKSAVLDVLGRRFNEVNLQAQPSGNGWAAQLVSKEIEGLVRWEGGSRELIRARLKNLTLPDVSPSLAGRSDEGELRELPELDIVADSFAISGHRFGRLDLLAHNAARTWLIDRLALNNPDGKLTGKGSWRPASAGQPHETRLEFELEANDVGKLLDRVGFPGTVKRGTANLDGRVQWRGTPTNIDYPSLSGDLKLNAKSGQFAKLEPGIGKLLGLLSLQSLPRRITLDFRDVFSDGFAFDVISGTTAVHNGLMKTDNLMIEGPAAKVTMSGEVDIGQETQRIKVRVQPAIGNSVALGAALFSNPVTGVATLLAQKFLQNPLDQIFSYEYMITGAWDDPKVDKLGLQDRAQGASTGANKSSGKDSAP